MEEDSERDRTIAKVTDDIDVKVFNHHFGSADDVVSALQGFAIVCAMRERTAFSRAVIERLPDLKLLITTGCAHPPPIQPHILPSGKMIALFPGLPEIGAWYRTTTATAKGWSLATSSSALLRN